MGYARIHVSPELIIRALHLPEDTRVVGAEMSHAQSAVQLYIAQPQLKNAILGSPDQWPLITPRFQSQCVEGQETSITFLDWGQD
jgi:hypothetical protein